MGEYKIEITAVGGHGCGSNRKAGVGDKLYGCRFKDCPDCLARDLVELLTRKGSSVKVALLRHWPGTEGEVVDDLLNQVRVSGTFTS